MGPTGPEGGRMSQKQAKRARKILAILRPGGLHPARRRAVTRAARKMLRRRAPFVIKLLESCRQEANR